MKLLRNKKALSPVVASIILIAVTVAVSIAVAAWMGALTFSFMGTEQLAITKVTWYWNTNPRTFVLRVNNTGTKDMTINQILVNWGSTGVGQPSNVPCILKSTQSVSLTVTYPYLNGTNYDISVVTSSGYKFTNNYAGGQNSG